MLARQLSLGSLVYFCEIPFIIHRIINLCSVNLLRFPFSVSMDLKTNVHFMLGGGLGQELERHLFPFP